VLEGIPTKEHAVIALGGGTACSESNLAFIRTNGISIYLKVDPEMLIGRLRQKKDRRPLTKGKSDQEIKTLVYQLLDKRAFYYEQADHVLEDDHPTVKKLLGLLGD
jgi:shikimate kinase